MSLDTASQSDPIAAAYRHPADDEVAETQMEIDVIFRDAFSQAKARGEQFAEADPRALAELTSAVVHTLALRARGGQPRPQLRRLADSAVDLICAGSAPRKASRRRPSSK